MDANGLRFWMLSRRDDFPWSAGTQGLQYCDKTHRLQLLSVSSAPAPVEDSVLAKGLVDSVPMARDRFDNYARWDSASGHVVAGGSAPGEVPIYTPPAFQSVTDLVLGCDGILYAAVGGALVMIDLRQRWPDFTLSVSGFTFWRLAALAEGGVLALDNAKPQLGTVTGQPLETGPVEVRPPAILRSCETNANPPRIASTYELPSSEKFVALAEMDSGQFALLSWGTTGSSVPAAFVHTFDENAGLGAPVQLGGVRWPYSLVSIGEGRLAVLVTNLKEAFIYDTSIPGSVAASASDSYVLSGVNVGPFVHGFTQPPYYASVEAGPSATFPLLPLSLNSFAAAGQTDPSSPAIFDSGSPQTIWHRLFLEAIVPPRCGVLVWLAATDTASDLMSMSTRWYPHVAGDADVSSIPDDVLSDVPRATWQSVTPEVAFAPALLEASPVANRQGLFMVLLQRAGKAVRNLEGRYLGVRIALNGDGRNTPELAALRAYASRFSYVNHYLPDIYREDKFGTEADANGRSTRRDFFERFVDSFEAQLTHIEDRVAGAYLLTRSEATPDESLDWLGTWVGIEPSAYPPDRRRARLESIPELYRQRGTASGLTLALDIATGGMCSRGAIVVIEDFRLRHIFATILGADLSIKADPLLPGYSPSSNSIVGDTLFLGNPGIAGELQALYATNLNLAGAPQQVERFYDSLANRVTVFIHDQVETVDALLVQRLVEQEKPAHVAASIQRASQAFMIGLTSLVGVNTYLAPEPPRGIAAVDVSQIGRYDLVTNLPSLDPRLESSTPFEWTSPIARLSGPEYVLQSDAILLDGSTSSSTPGVPLISYQWSLRPPS